MLGEALVLRRHAEVWVVRQVHPPGRLSPAGNLLAIDTERARLLGMALGGLRRAAQVLLGHEVGVDVVVGDGTVFVGSADAVDAEMAGGAQVAEGEKQSRRLDEQLQADLLLERGVAGRLDVL